MQGASFVRSAGLWLIIGSIVGVGVGVKEAVFPTPFGTLQNVIMQVIVIISNTLTLIGMVGLARSGAVGTSILAKSGLGIAILASALFLPFEVLVIVNLELGGMFLGICALLQGLGLLLTGIAVLQAKHWHNWQRFIPLLCGLYTFLVLIPLLALNDGYNAWALVGWQVTYLALGFALRQQRSVPMAETVVVGV